MNVIMGTLGISKYNIITIEQVDSTNKYALENFSTFDDKTVIFTKDQTMGRGRYNRKWVCDDSENLYASIILKPQNTEDFPFANLTQYLSTIICKCLKNEFKINAEIKWPNDILINGYKISGILAESKMQNGKITGIILGFGININLKQETLDKIDQKATSLSVLLDKTFNPENILNLICDEFFKNYDDFINEGFKFIKSEYLANCNFLGKKITIKESDKKNEYFALSIDDDGLLIVKNEIDEECRIITGDIYVK